MNPIIKNALTLNAFFDPSQTMQPSGGQPPKMVVVWEMYCTTGTLPQCEARASTLFGRVCCAQLSTNPRLFNVYATSDDGKSLKYVGERTRIRLHLGRYRLEMKRMVEALPPESDEERNDYRLLRYARG